MSSSASDNPEHSDQAEKPATPIKQPVYCKRHPSEKTGLSCNHCGVPICPKCMITCEVGFKCQDCVQLSASHLTKVGWQEFALGLLLGLLVGYVFGLIYPLMMALSFWGLALAYVLGNGIGRLVHGYLKHKLNPRLSLWVSACFFVGAFWGPFGRNLLSIILGLISFLTVPQTVENITVSGGASGISTDWMIISVLLHLGCLTLFYKGFRQPFSGIWF